jgi:Rieske Fe-S protein
MAEHDDDRTLSAHPRRTVLRGALVLGAAGVLSACGGSSSDNAAAQTPTDAGATTPPESTPTPTAKAKKKAAKPKATATATPTAEAKASAKPKATAKTAVAPKGTELGPSSAVPVGGGKIYEDQKIVVTQPKAGEFLAFSAVCTHQACILADCDGGKINCGCHASSFDLTTGVPDGGPATVPLPKMKVSVVGGKVYKL